MKYINPYYPWFTSIGNMKYSGSKDGCLAADGWGIVVLDEDTGTHMKMSFDMMITASYMNEYTAGFYFKSVRDKAVDDVFLYVNNSNYMEIRLANKNVLTTSFKVSRGIWYHVFLDVDTVAGCITVYVDGNKIGEYTDYVKTGAMAKDFRFYLNSSYYKMKNMIVTDGELSINETIMEVETSVESCEWNEAQDGYSTEDIGKKIVLKPARTKIDGYTITAAGIVWENALGSDNVPSVNISMGQKSKKVQLPSGNSHNAGACFDRVVALENIVVTSAE